MIKCSIRFFSSNTHVARVAKHNTSVPQSRFPAPTCPTLIPHLTTPKSLSECSNRRCLQSGPKHAPQIHSRQHPLPEKGHQRPVRPRTHLQRQGAPLPGRHPPPRHRQHPNTAQGRPLHRRRLVQVHGQEPQRVRLPRARARPRRRQRGVPRAQPRVDAAGQGRPPVAAGIFY